MEPHAVVQAGANSYAYDQNGNMTSRTVDGVVWTYAYNAENQLITTHKSNQLIMEYGYDGDGKRVWAKDYEGYLPDNPRLTVYIGNYYEARVEGYRPPTGGDPVQPCIAPSFCVYFPLVVKSAVENVSYYYADGQRIAMKKDGAVYYLYGDQLGSVSAVVDGSGAMISRSLYEPWGVARYQTGSNITDYAYTGQMREGDVYFYNARWPKVPAMQWRGYDPAIGRFMQADTFVPTSQGTQGFDRFAYVNNNPMVYRDENGHWITTLVGGIIGAAIGYGVQVYQNVQSGMEFEDALTTNISAEKILAGAAAGAIAGTLLPVAATAISTTGLFTTGTTTITAACADGDCTNEASATLEGIKTTGEFVSQKIGSTGSIGQKALESIHGYSQVYLATPYGGRFIDRLSDLGTAMEAKVGYQVLTYTIKTQIIKDAFLLQNNPAVQAVEWHFLGVLLQEKWDRADLCLIS